MIQKEKTSNICIQLANKYNISYLLVTDKRYDSNDLNNKTFSAVLDYYDSLKDSNE